MTAQTRSAEQRSTTRYQLYRPVRLHRFHPSQIIETLTKDLSAGGLRCLSASAISVSTELSIELTLSTGGAPISATGRTVWFRTIPHSDQMDLGIAFTGFSGDDARRLSAYLEHMAQV